MHKSRGSYAHVQASKRHYHSSNIHSRQANMAKHYTEGWGNMVSKRCGMGRAVSWGESQGLGLLGLRFPIPGVDNIELDEPAVCLSIRQTLMFLCFLAGSWQSLHAMAVCTCFGLSIEKCDFVCVHRDRCNSPDLTQLQSSSATKTKRLTFIPYHPCLFYPTLSSLVSFPCLIIPISPSGTRSQCSN